MNHAEELLCKFSPEIFAAVILIRLFSSPLLSFSANTVMLLLIFAKKTYKITKTLANFNSILDVDHKNCMASEAFVTFRFASDQLVEISIIFHVLSRNTELKQ